MKIRGNDNCTEVLLISGCPATCLDLSSSKLSLTYTFCFYHLTMSIKYVRPSHLLLLLSPPY